MLTLLVPAVMFILITVRPAPVSAACASQPHTSPGVCRNRANGDGNVCVLVQAHQEAAARGEGCAVLDGSLIERLHSENARRVIELHESITALEAGQEGGGIGG